MYYACVNICYRGKFMHTCMCVEKHLLFNKLWSSVSVHVHVHENHNVNTIMHFR